MSDETTPEPEHILLHADWSIEVSEEEKKRRERDWLLADIDPSPGIEQRRREHAMNALYDMNREALDRAAENLPDDVKERAKAWLDKEQERPVSGEGT